MALFELLTETVAKIRLACLTAYATLPHACTGGVAESENVTKCMCVLGTDGRIETRVGGGQLQGLEVRPNVHML